MSHSPATVIPRLEKKPTAVIERDVHKVEGRGFEQLLEYILQDCKRCKYCVGFAELLLSGQHL